MREFVVHLVLLLYGVAAVLVGAAYREADAYRAARPEYPADHPNCYAEPVRRHVEPVRRRVVIHFVCAQPVQDVSLNGWLCEVVLQ